MDGALAVHNDDGPSNVIVIAVTVAGVVPARHTVLHHTPPTVLVLLIEGLAQVLPPRALSPWLLSVPLYVGPPVRVLLAADLKLVFDRTTDSARTPVKLDDGFGGCRNLKLHDNLDPLALEGSGVRHGLRRGASWSGVSLPSDLVSPLDSQCYGSVDARRVQSGALRCRDTECRGEPLRDIRTGWLIGNICWMGANGWDECIGAICSEVLNGTNRCIALLGEWLVLDETRRHQPKPVLADVTEVI